MRILSRSDTLLLTICKRIFVKVPSISSACRNLSQAKDPEQATVVLPLRLPRRQRKVWSNFNYLLGRFGNWLTDKRTYNLCCVNTKGRAIKQLSQPIGHPQQAWLDIIDKYIPKNEIESECSDGDGVPQVVGGVPSIESDDEVL